MCNIKTKTDLKEVIVYKAVIKKDDKYFAPLSGVQIKTGTVTRQKKSDAVRKLPKQHLLRRFTEGDCFYKPIMKGKTSGFEKLSDAILYRDEIGNPSIILEMKLGGEIWVGDAYRVSTYIDYDAVIYAGTEVLSITEV